ncbi:hypothetical protein AACH06_28935 [Ideonella sp. DXS29W]|uniref:Uncharacterized protein n=1 Tax=Ideonella lacteola TaxID=2984193 RepID=A0ABU9BZI4_9BURK
MDLALDGPEKYLKRPEFEFSARPAALSYLQEFSLRAVALDLESPEACRQFADWAACHAMGQNLDLAEVSFGYQLDHLLEDCRDSAAAIALVRSELPSLLPQCKVISAPFVELDA